MSKVVRLKEINRQLLGALKQLAAQMDAPEVRSRESDSCFGAEEEAFERAYQAIKKAEEGIRKQ